MQDVPTVLRYPLLGVFASARIIGEVGNGSGSSGAGQASKLQNQGVNGRRRYGRSAEQRGGVRGQYRFRTKALAARELNLRTRQALDLPKGHVLKANPIRPSISPDRRPTV